MHRSCSVHPWGPRLIICPTSAAWKRKNCVQTPNCEKITYDKNNYFQNFSTRGDSRHNNVQYLHACNRGWDLWEGPHLDILSRGPRVPSYATAGPLYLCLLAMLRKTLANRSFVSAHFSSNSVWRSINWTPTPPTGETTKQLIDVQRTGGDDAIHAT